MSSGPRLQPDGSVVLPPELARPVLHALLIGLRIAGERDGSAPGPAAVELLRALAVAAARRPVPHPEQRPVGAPSMVTTAEAGQLLGCSTSLVRRWCRTGRLPARRAAGGWLIDRNAIGEPDDTAAAARRR